MWKSKRTSVFVALAAVIVYQLLPDGTIPMILGVKEAQDVGFLPNLQFYADRKGMISNKIYARMGQRGRGLFAANTIKKGYHNLLLLLLLFLL